MKFGQDLTENSAQHEPDSKVEFWKSVAIPSIFLSTATSELDRRPLDF
jgi:hypothetical protein